jgi:hypothetical protein
MLYKHLHLQTADRRHTVAAPAEDAAGAAICSRGVAVLHPWGYRGLSPSQLTWAPPSQFHPVGPAAPFLDPVAQLLQATRPSPPAAGRHQTAAGGPPPRRNLADLLPAGSGALTRRTSSRRDPGLRPSPPPPSLGSAEPGRRGARSPGCTRRHPLGPRRQACSTAGGSTRRAPRPALARAPRPRTSTSPTRSSSTARARRPAGSRAPGGARRSSSPDPAVRINAGADRRDAELQPRSLPPLLRPHLRCAQPGQHRRRPTLLQPRRLQARAEESSMPGRAEQPSQELRDGLRTPLDASLLCSTGTPSLVLHISRFADARGRHCWRQS